MNSLKKSDSLNNEHVWFQWFGWNSDVLCPCCGQTVLKNYGQTSNWQVCSICPISLGGKKIYPNAIITCIPCFAQRKQLGMHLYDFMVAINRMSPNDVATHKQNLANEIANFNPICEHVSMGFRCTLNKWTKRHAYCKNHSLINLDVVPMEF